MSQWSSQNWTGEPSARERANLTCARRHTANLMAHSTHFRPLVWGKLLPGRVHSRLVPLAAMPVSYGIPQGTIVQRRSARAAQDSAALLQRLRACRQAGHDQRRNPSLSICAPAVEDNADGWGPTSEPPQLKDVPFAPYSKADKIGRAADWTQAAYQKYPGELQQAHACVRARSVPATPADAISCWCAAACQAATANSLAPQCSTSLPTRRCGGSGHHQQTAGPCTPHHLAELCTVIYWPLNQPRPLTESPNHLLHLREIGGVLPRG